MYPYTWQLFTKFGKIQICQRKVIAKNDEFTMDYVIARSMRATTLRAVSNGCQTDRNEVPFRMIPSIIYVQTENCE